VNEFAYIACLSQPFRLALPLSQVNEFSLHRLLIAAVSACTPAFAGEKPIKSPVYKRGRRDHEADFLF